MSINIKYIVSLIACLWINALFAAEFKLSSSSFQNKDRIPARYTCDGADLSPQIAWTNPPINTRTFALIMRDPTTARGTLYHWVLYNIPSTTLTLSEGLVNRVEGLQVGRNDMGNIKYNGPCPPKGSVHTYHFTLFALDTYLTLDKAVSAKTVLNAMQKHIIGQTELTTIYSR